MEPNTLRYAAVPTLPLSGGKLKTVTAILFSYFFFLDSLQQCLSAISRPAQSA